MVKPRAGSGAEKLMRSAGLGGRGLMKSRGPYVGTRRSSSCGFARAFEGRTVEVGADRLMVAKFGLDVSVLAPRRRVSPTRARPRSMPPSTLGLPPRSSPPIRSRHDAPAISAFQSPRWRNPSRCGAAARGERFGAIRLNSAVREHPSRACE